MTRRLGRARLDQVVLLDDGSEAAGWLQEKLSVEGITASSTRPEVEPSAVLLLPAGDRAQGQCLLQAYRAAGHVGAVLMYAHSPPQHLTEALFEAGCDDVIDTATMEPDELERLLRRASLRAGVARREARRRTENLEVAELLGVGLWVVDAERDEATGTQGLNRLLGLAADAPAPRVEELLAMVHVDDREAVRRFLTARVESPSETVELRLVRPDGSVAHLLCAWQPGGRRRADRPTRWLLRDVTEARDLRERLVDERTQASALTQATGEGTVLQQLGVVLEVNGALTAMTGWSRAELVGLPHLPFLSADDEAAAADGPVEVMAVRKDGSTFPARVVAQLLTGANGFPTGLVTTLQDRTLERARLEALQAEALHDPLTGLGNRRAFTAFLAGRTEVALVVLDIDHFKAVNDTHGHVVGDEVLSEVAFRLTRMAGPDDCLARIGGEEFAWVLPDADLTTAAAQAEHVRQVIASSPFHHVGALTVSAGVAVGAVQEVYERADAKLYAAKRAGRNRVVA